MPRKAQRACNHPGCYVLTRERYCPAHAAKVLAAYEAQRETATERGYDAQWATVRRMKLARNPLCERCEVKGLVVAAALVHHKDRNPKNNEDRNHESLCRECHDAEHRGERWVTR